MDICYHAPEGTFNYRVCAIMLHNGHILAMRDERSPYYYLPGGRVQLHETAEDALLRELSEELGITAQIVRPLWLNQGFFTEDIDGERYHELCLYFLVDIAATPLLSRGDTFTYREGSRQHRFEWLRFEQLENEYFYPLFLKETIKNLPDTFTLITNVE